VRRAGVAFVALVLAGLANAAGPSPGAKPIVVSGCEGVYYEKLGLPQLVIVSDLPLEDSAHTAMHQMTQAIKLTLKDRGFKAGRFSVGYVVCDDSGSAGSWSATRCVANARAAVRSAKVVGTIGTLDSGCARAELPVLGRANVVLVSPLNTASGLTHGERGKVALLSATDDVQAADAARFLLQSGATTVAALSDGTRRGDAYRSDFAVAARRLQLRVVARGRADAAYVGGVLAGRTRAIIAAARRRAPGGTLALAAGYGPAAQLAAVAGPAANGAYLFVAGIPLERLGETGQSFVTHFESAIGTAPHPYAVYAAQAARLLLDAIARSSGARADVGRAVLASRVREGLTGSFAFAATGDLRPAPVTIFRVEDRTAQIVRVVHSGLP
jgi:branched-chain amino acid transport system substrate-binding protein